MAEKAHSSSGSDSSNRFILCVRTCAQIVRDHLRLDKRDFFRKKTFSGQPLDAANPSFASLLAKTPGTAGTEKLRLYESTCITVPDLTVLLVALVPFGDASTVAADWRQPTNPDG